ncbi:ZNF473 isoform 7 [Pan troglodytes]|uniref:Zinc finger protein 473 n=2 Tax=Homininae TaxID=207598 RepID=M0R2N2_HUMAN|nr:zinc finger protein 473 [Homo sapiens]KAI4044135.1 zinc finger protein 473 [Homo sapiens]PNI16502.1 ZNF473 isoform 7 [Pan troglodytes]
MDFTLGDWEQLGLEQGDTFWDTALDNCQDLFLLGFSQESSQPAVSPSSAHQCHTVRQQQGPDSS